LRLSILSISFYSLLDLKNVRNTTDNNIEIALASSSEKYNYDRKVSRPETKKLLSLFDDDRLILGDDPRVQYGRGKLASDIYLLALQTINSSLHGSGTEITPEVSLVFKDSVPGVEAGRRAGMRVVWVPHPELAAEYKGREKEVLAGRIGLVKVSDEWQLGEINDG
jgi:pseudouridine-5'-monophosphatase